MGGGGDTPTPRVKRETVIRERTVVQERTPEPRELSEQHAIETEGAVTTMMWLYGINNGAWRRHDIDMSIEVAAFGKYTRQVTAGLSNLSGGVSLPPVMNFRDQGEDIVIYGVKLNFYNQMLTMADSGIGQMPDDLDALADASLGVPFESSTTTNAYRGIFLSEFDFDILEDTAETRAASPPVLWNLLQDGELDVIIEFSGFTVRANATDEVTTIFDPYEFWLNSGHDYPPPVAPWIAYRDWLQDNADIALRFLDGWEDAVTMSKENIDQVIQNYGRLSGLTTEDEGDVARDWMDQNKIVGNFAYDQGYADDNWELVQMLHDAEAFQTLPAKEDLFVTNDQLREWAGR